MDKLVFLEVQVVEVEVMLVKQVVQEIHLQQILLKEILEVHQVLDLYLVVEEVVELLLQEVPQLEVVKLLQLEVMEKQEHKLQLQELTAHMQRVLVGLYALVYPHVSAELLTM